MDGWKCRMIEYVKESNGLTLEIGDMFYGPTEKEVEVDDRLSFFEQVGLSWPYFFCQDHKLTQYYRDHNAHRRPLLVMLPGRVLFCVDSMGWKDGVYRGGWEVKGEPPNITVWPSIDMGSIYHGYLTNGIIGRDVAGVQYNLDGTVRK